MRGGITGIADDKFARRASDHLDHAVGDVVLNEQESQRRAALAGGAERRSHDIVGDLLGQCGGVDDHRIDTAGLRDQRHDRSVLGGERAVDRPRDFGRAGEDHAGDVGMRHQRGADPSVACHQMQRRHRHAGFMQQPHGLCGNQRRLFGWFCNDRVAGHQCCRDLPQKNRQRKIPRRDRDEDATAAQAKYIALAGRPRHRLAFSEQFASLGGVVAAKIHGLADFRNRVVKRLAALALQQCDEMRRALFQQIGGLFQCGCARAGRRSAPVLETIARGRDRRIRCCFRRLGDASRRGQ